MKNAKTILIAEDDPAILKVAADTLKGAGFNVIEADDGEKALDLSLKNHPDCILLDIMMPKMNGLSVLERLRQDEWGKSVYIIVLTNFGDGEKVARATENYVFDYLIKSDWKLEDIIKKIKEKLGV